MTRLGESDSDNDGQFRNSKHGNPFYQIGS